MRPVCGRLFCSIINCLSQAEVFLITQAKCFDYDLNTLIVFVCHTWVRNPNLKHDITFVANWVQRNFTFVYVFCHWFCFISLLFATRVVWNFSNTCENNPYDCTFVLVPMWLPIHINILPNLMWSWTVLLTLFNNVLSWARPFSSCALN